MIYRNIKKYEKFYFIWNYFFETILMLLQTVLYNFDFKCVLKINLQCTIHFYGFQWSKIQSAKFSILEHQMDPSSNFSSYRSTLKAAMWRSAGATDERQRIVVPFFSLLVKDLYFLNEGCSNKWVISNIRRLIHIILQSKLEFNQNPNYTHVYIIWTIYNI